MAVDPRSEGWQELFARLRARAPLAARYDIGLEISHGGMGRILEVRDPDLRRRLAMKVLRGEPSERAVARFLEEAQIAAQLDHPGIVPVHEVGVDTSGRVYFTMKRVAGHDLREAFRKVRTGEDGWNEPRVLGVLLRVCEAMAFAHSRNVVHRDLKPANIMVGRFGETYVMDWGLARVLDARTDQSVVHTDRHDLSERDPQSPLLTKDGDVLGTAPYMPPEQASGRTEAIDPRADVYAIGAILYELLGGHAPYLDRQRPMAVTDVVAGPPTPLSRLAPRASPELVSICGRAMARTLHERYQTMQALADDLRAFLEHRVVAAYRTGPLAELRKWVQRNKAVAAAAALLFVVTAAAGVAITSTARREAAHLRLTSELREAGELLAATPERAGLLAWLERAQAFVARTAPYRDRLEALQARGQPLGDGEWAEQRKLHPDFRALWQKEQRARLEFAPRVQAAGAVVADAQRTAAEREAAREEVTVLEPEIALLERRVRLLRARVERSRWQLPAALAAEHGRLVQMVDALDELTDPLIGRMALVADVAEDDARAEADPGWPAAIAAIAERYGGLRLRPQAGLVPLGPDPRSGLHEFWHPASGARPGRDGEGRLAIESQTGLVFVLVPGGRFWMGSTKRTDGPNHDPHSRVEEQEPFEVALDPYFLSKYEMTQGQWIRLTADNPSSRFAGMRDGGQSWTRTHPVENVDWVTADRELRRFGMKLPTEAQFERAMRGGTATACWWGDDYLDGRELRANCYDDVEPGDGHRLDAPVDSFEPNPFGFYCIAGNLWEWCDDWAVRAFADADVQPGTGRLDAPLATKKTLRGGGFRADVRYLGSARRMPESAQALAADYGLRPARALQR